MKTMTQRKSWIALVALLFLFVACKGDSPTAPPAGGGGTPPPPSGTTNLVLSASNTSPLVDSTVVLTATVTQGGNPVPNGTAVEFSADGGSFDGTSATSILKTTTNGVASVTLTSSVAKTIRVRAAINNLAQTVDVTFRTRPVVEPPPDLTPSISSVDPAVGRPTGGQTIRINGTNFKAPVRVLFDIGTGTPVEAFVVSTTETTIDVLTPAINLGAGQQLAADVIVITQVGSAAEQRVEKAGAFTFRNEKLTPLISTVTPNSGPVTGNTRVSIFGEGFQAPVQVLFGTAEARVITVEFNEIVVETPAGRDTSPDGSDTITGPVDVTVRNINSQTSASMTAGFHYKNAVVITAAGPTIGPASGGTRVTIEGTGFLAPVAVVIGGVAAQPISVSGTKIIAISSGVQVEGCGDVSGEIAVTNINNGDTAVGPDFTYDVPQPSIVTVSDPEPTAGEMISVTVAGALPGAVRFTIGGKTVFPSTVSYDPATGVGIYAIAVPTNLEFETGECGNGGEQNVPTSFDLAYENSTTGCTDQVAGALTVTPLDVTCRGEELEPNITVVSPAATSCPGLTINSPATSGVITIRNTGTAPLQISEVTASPDTAFTVNPTAQTIAVNSEFPFTVTFNPAGGDQVGTVTFTTDDPDSPTVSVCVTGNAP